MTVLKKPFDGSYPITQTYAEHLANAVNYPPGHYNGGIDYALPIGTPVLAAADGRIAKVDNSPTGYGIYVTLESPDDAFGTIATLYAHLSRVSCAPNDYLHTGDIIGMSGSTGNSTGPHLHFEARHNGQVVDPGIYFQSAPIQPVEVIGTYQALGTLNVRHSANLDPASIVGQIPPGWIYSVVNIVTAAGVTWGKTDSGYFVAITRGSEVLSKKV